MSVPNLRFPEFKNAGEWEEKAFEKCLDYLQPTDFLVVDENYNNSYKTPVLTAGKTFILGYTNEQNGIFRDNLPVIIFDDFTTASQYVDFPFKAKSSAMKILQPKEGTNIKFMFETLQMLKFEVGVHGRHWISSFASMLITVPTIPEQQKIADCLSSLDDLIAAHNQKLATLKTHRKGLMQQLFPTEGETVPTLRFPEFEGKGEWYRRVLNEFISERSQIDSSGLPLFSLTIENGITPKTKRYVRSFLVRDEDDAYKAVHQYDFAFNPMNLRFGALAMHHSENKVSVSKYYHCCPVNFRILENIAGYSTEYRVVLHG